MRKLPDWFLRYVEWCNRQRPEWLVLPYLALYGLDWLVLPRWWGLAAAIVAGYLGGLLFGRLLVDYFYLGIADEERQLDRQLDQMRQQLQALVTEHAPRN